MNSRPHLLRLPILLVGISFGCQPLTHEVSVPAHGQGGATSVRKYTPRHVDAESSSTVIYVPATLPAEVVKEQERKQTRLEELESKVKQLETENAELKKSQPASQPMP